MEFTDIKDWLVTLPLWLQIIVIPLILIVFSYKHTKPFWADVKNLAFRAFSNNNFFAHGFFYRRNWLLQQINRVVFLDSKRTDAFHIILMCKTKIVIDDTKVWLKTNSKKLKKMNQVELEAELMGHTDQLIKTYEAKILAQYQSAYGAKNGLAVYQLVYEKYFKEHHESNVAYVMSGIKTISMSYAKNFTDTIQSYLLFLLLALDRAIVDCEDAFRQINGEFDAIFNIDN